MAFMPSHHGSRAKEGDMAGMRGNDYGIRLKSWIMLNVSNVLPFSETLVERSWFLGTL